MTGTTGPTAKGATLDLEATGNNAPGFTPVGGNPVQLTGPEVLQDSAGTGSFEVTNCTVAGLTGTIPAG